MAGTSNHVFQARSQMQLGETVVLKLAAEEK
jgi:hypothetical protein